MVELVSTFKKGDLITPEQAMKLAIDVAYEGAPFVSPNPLVGCVIVDRNHQLLATGYHPKFGAEHAEINALNKLSVDELKNSTLYVTLEPCAHQGKTPSCAKHIATMPVKKVVYGLVDPNPLVSGKGAEILTAAGKTATLYDGPLKADLEDVCEVFLKNYRKKRIFIAAKVATSLDGQIALSTGESKWITTEASREYVHELRGRYDAIIVGRNTIEKDDPSLNIRHSKISKSNKIVIIDRDSKIIEQMFAGRNYKFLEVHSPENIYFVTEKPVAERFGQQIPFSTLNQLTRSLWDLGMRSAFVEGGATTYSSFLTENLVDRLHIFMASSIIGAENGLSWTKHLKINKLDEKKILSNVKTRMFSSDIYLTGRL